jgi:hypothetical protein
MSQSKVSRIETGRLLPSVVDVEQLLTALEVDDGTRRELALARVANAEYQDVRASVRRGLHHRQRELAALEANATLMRHFLPALVTGLLQTPEYMRVAMSSPLGPADGDVGKAITLKLERQAVLYDKAKNFEFLLTESAIRWQLCESSIMAVQMDRLVSLSQQSNIRLGVLPLSKRVRNGAYHTFVTYDRRLVTIELFSGRLVLRDPKDIDYYWSLFDFFGAHALWADQAREILRALADTFRTGN